MPRDTFPILGAMLLDRLAFSDGEVVVGSAAAQTALSLDNLNPGMRARVLDRLDVLAE